MTATPNLSAATSLPSSTLLRRAVASEWTRLWSVRSTWIGLGAAAVVALLVGALGRLDAGHVPGSTPLWLPGEMALQVLQWPLLAVAMLAATADQTTGMIRSTLLWVPRRGLLHAARTLVVVAVVVVVGVVLVLGTIGLSWWLMGDAADVVVSEVAQSLAGVAAVLGTGAVLAVSLGMLLRSAAGTMTSLFLLLLVLPAVLQAFPVAWLRWLGAHLPGGATTSLLQMTEPVLEPPAVAVVLVLWLGGVTAAAVTSLVRRDAS